MKYSLLTMLLILISVVVSAQKSVDTETSQVVVDAFSNAMIRNVLIIIVIAVFYFLFKYLKNKDKS